jgi:glycosyltransferase involved in cell wall biosynthesis
VESRSAWREKFGAGENEWLAVYGGRVSLQKNVEPLLEIWRRFRSVAHAKLVIAGTFDDLGAPLTGIREPLNGSFQRFESCLAGSGAIYAGALSRDEMAGLYNAADAYLSLSAHHDEDFGLAPAEALCSGAAVLLSDWGGYSSFAGEVPGDSYFIPVRFAQPRGLALDRAKAFATLIQMSNVENFASRVERSARYRSRLSIEAVRDSLQTILNRSPHVFAGFSTAAHAVAGRMRQGSPFSHEPEGRKIYEFLYADYLS